MSGYIIAFSDISGIAFSYFQDQITHISTCCNRSDGQSDTVRMLYRTSSERQLKQKKKKMDQDKILAHSRVNGTLKVLLVLLGNAQSATIKK